MIRQKVESAINGQINREFYSSYLYISMAAYFESINLKGFAHWMRTQANEELGHAMRLYDYLVERGGGVALQPIEAPPSKWKSPKEVFQEAYRHEQKVTEFIHKLVDLAKSEKDHATEVFLQWFVKEQVEEEASTYEISQKLQLIGTEGTALFMLDGELRKRASSSK